MTEDDRERQDRERRLQRLGQQWAAGRADRRLPPAPVLAGSTNFSRAQVPWGLDLAAAWSWRVLVIGAAGLALLKLLALFAVIALPLAIALLFTALASPVVNLLDRLSFPRPIAALLMVVVGIGSVVLLLTFAGQQVAAGAHDLADEVVKGLGQIKAWLKNGPLNATDSQINTYLDQAQDVIRQSSESGGVLTRVTEVGTAVGHGVAGFFIVLFATYFFLADGHRIWSWFVRLAPRAARGHVDGSGRVAWVSLTRFVQATVLVAAVDAMGIMIVAALIGIPFILAIGVLVFLGAFVPMIGATIAGGVAVLVALVDQGPWAALLMLGGVILVQQIEGHILQPFLMGRFVSVHPLGVIVAIGCGVLVAGVAGALIAVPLASMVNAVVHYLARETPPTDPVEALERDLAAGDSDAPELPEEAEQLGRDDDETAGTGEHSEGEARRDD
ncbi:AI-2E family transporter [Nocardioides rotundus]|uniref:AI-2E family transporter n=1 Tax=Nocardioides rotundus TaxID=1774216 RepID=UPI001CBB9A5C|nr:AI-2E family transporter [Nocardioides rotundus]UAL30639.1 AI-2E family transporter [Nocardioides rotundus]